MKAIILSTMLSLLAPGDEKPSSPTPAAAHVERAMAKISKQPDNAQGYNDLAMAFARQARESANSELYERGLRALHVSEALEPANFGARRTRTWLLLGQHRFQEALELATALNQEVPDDVLVYGFLVDAHMELGNYAAAEEACQWMLDLRPGNVAGLTRASYLREMFGDAEGALQMMAEAYHGIAPSEREDQAWILTQMAQLQRGLGRGEIAATLLQRALTLFPEYHYALAEQGQLSLGAGEYAAAAALFQRRYAAAPHPENLLDLARALEADGQLEQAGALFAKFEAGARQEAEGLDNANRELALYLLDQTPVRAPEALEIATKEREFRRDVFTLQTYAWALLANDRVAEAREQIEQALAVGRRDALLQFHAGSILLRAGEEQAGREQLLACLELSPSASLAERARKLLDGLEATSGAAH